MNFLNQLVTLFGDIKDVFKVAVNQVESWMDLVATLGVAIPAIVVVFGVVIAVRAWGKFND